MWSYKDTYLLWLKHAPFVLYQNAEVVSPLVCIEIGHLSKPQQFKAIYAGIMLLVYYSIELPLCHAEEISC